MADCASVRGDNSVAARRDPLVDVAEDALRRPGDHRPHERRPALHDRAVLPRLEAAERETSRERVSAKPNARRERGFKVEKTKAALPRGRHAQNEKHFKSGKPLT